MVVLPQPEGPSKVTNSPGSIVRETLSTAVTFFPPELSKVLTKFLTLTLLDADNPIASLPALYVRDIDSHPVEQEFENACDR